MGLSKIMMFEEKLNAIWLGSFKFRVMYISNLNDGRVDKNLKSIIIKPKNSRSVMMMKERKEG